MGHRDVPPLRSLPRFFLPGAECGPGKRLELPPEELRKARNVLRLSTGDCMGLLPDDGSLWSARLDGREVVCEEQHFPATEPPRHLTLALGLPRPEKLEESVRMATELGASSFLVFPAARSVVRWEPTKLAAKLDRLRVIAREAAEVAYRTKLPSVRWAASLTEVLAGPDVWVLSEVEDVHATLPAGASDLTLVVGPEGGWSPAEVGLIGDRAVTLGPRVLRVDTAAAAATALALSL